MLLIPIRHIITLSTLQLILFMDSCSKSHLGLCWLLFFLEKSTAVLTCADNLRNYPCSSYKQLEQFVEIVLAFLSIVVAKSSRSLCRGDCARYPSIVWNHHGENQWKIGKFYSIEGARETTQPKRNTKDNQQRIGKESWKTHMETIKTTLKHPTGSQNMTRRESFNTEYVETRTTRHINLLGFL